MYAEVLNPPDLFSGLRLPHPGQIRWSRIDIFRSGYEDTVDGVGLLLLVSTGAEDNGMKNLPSTPHESAVGEERSTTQL